MSQEPAARDAVIVGVGLLTAVGVTSRETAASVRAGTTRFTETTIRDRQFEPVTLATVPDDVLPPLLGGVENVPGLTSRMRRMLRLAGAPLREAVSLLPPHAPRPGLILSVPESPTTIPFDGQVFLSALGNQVGDAFDPTYSAATQIGRAGGVLSIDQAAALVSSGRVPLMVAGGVDTYQDTYVLGTMDRDQRLKSASNLDGFIPGEAAAFVLLAGRRRAAELGLAVMATISPASSGHESGHLYSEEPYRGDGLAMTLSELFAEVSPERPVVDVYSSMNGESHWAKEWSVAYLRNRSGFDSEFRVHHPADCYGDVGAATAPALVVLALLEMRGGHRPSPGLVYSSSDHGQRAALFVQTA